MKASAPWKLVHHAEIDSTQSEARRLLTGDGPVHRWAVSADVQRAGVGRRGRRFESPPGGAWQTLVVADPGGRHRDGRLAPELALAVAQDLSEQGRRVTVKWPNDLFRDGRKCGGILIERVGGHLLVGVGIDAENVPPEGFARVDLPAAAVRALVRASLDRVLETPHADLAAAWAPFDALRGRGVTLGCERGIACGITADGALRLRTASGDVLTFRTGSVTAVDPPLDRSARPDRS